MLLSTLFKEDGDEDDEQWGKGIHSLPSLPLATNGAFSLPLHSIIFGDKEERRLLSLAHCRLMVMVARSRRQPARYNAVARHQADKCITESYLSPLADLKMNPISS